MIDYQRKLFAPLLRRLGQPAGYLPREGPALALSRAVFTCLPLRQELDGVVVAGEQPTLGLPRAALPENAGAGDRVEVAGRAFLVERIQTDDAGWAVLFLRRS